MDWLTSLFVQSTFLTSLFSSVKALKTFSTHRISSFFALSARLRVPVPRNVFFKVFKCFSTHSASFRRSSVEMISISRHGSTSPSTCVTSASSNAPVLFTKKSKSQYNGRMEIGWMIGSWRGDCRQYKNLRTIWKIPSTALT